MSGFEYIRNYYNVPAKRGAVVEYAGIRGAEVTIIYIERELNAANAEIADLKAKLATARDDYENEVFFAIRSRFDRTALPGLVEIIIQDIREELHHRRSLKSSSGG